MALTSSSFRLDWLPRSRRLGVRRDLFSTQSLQVECPRHERLRQLRPTSRTEQKMCLFYYLHHHHIPPCYRDVDIVVHYIFCNHSAVDAATGVQLPCANVSYDHTQSSVDYNNPCASGGCLASPDCSSGACRLAQLNGRWICCQCERGGNTLRWCFHPMKTSPDTFCYHVCCSDCAPDASDEAN